MAAMNCVNFNSTGYCFAAAACTSAPIVNLLDTAINLVVSICVLCLRLVRIIG